MASLGVNVDHVATIRQARGVTFPDPVEAALICQRAGANSIVAHLREDRRHIQDRDVVELKKKLMIKLNLEASLDASVLKVVMRVRPDSTTLVPERRQEKTTESGLNVRKMERRIGDATVMMQKKGILVSLFVDPSSQQIKDAKKLGADAVEIHTGKYANATSPRQIKTSIDELRRALETAGSLGLAAHVGHGLDYDNVGPIAQIQGIRDFNIGYAIIARSLFEGLERAVAEMKRLVERA